MMGGHLGEAEAFHRFPRELRDVDRPPRERFVRLSRAKENRDRAESLGDLHPVAAGANLAPLEVVQLHERNGAVINVRRMSE